MKKEMICIGCPMGCYLSVDYIGTKILTLAETDAKLGWNTRKKRFPILNEP